MPDNKIGVIGYCGLVVRVTVRHAISRASFVIAIISFITGAAMWLVPTFGMTIDASVLVAMLRSPAFYAAVVWLVIIVNFICAQYLIWTEEHNARIKAESQVAELSARISPPPNTAHSIPISMDRSAMSDDCLSPRGGGGR